jgi:hypothetical protein
MQWLISCTLLRPCACELTLNQNENNTSAHTCSSATATHERHMLTSIEPTSTPFQVGIKHADQSIGARGHKVLRANEDGAERN